MTVPEPPNPEQAAFNLLHPAVQRRLWEMRWESLRPLQVSGIRAILQSQEHVILSAPTAAGKTEAAFLPILSAIADDARGSVRTVYVGPLKALINDQFMRIMDLCEHLDVPVYSWHGDIASNKKEKLIADPAGVLLITPESIESLFVNRSSHLRRLFSGLRFIVIDELHTFLDDERGLHLRSLLSRLLAKTEAPETVRIVGLSATIGDMSVAKRFVAPDRPDPVLVVEDLGGGKELKMRVHCYVSAPPVETTEEQEAVPDDAFEHLADDLVRHCAGAANLVFANSRADVELLADACMTRGKKMRLPDRFMVHHGSLSADIRRDAEATMKAGAVATTFCTPTLELGVDIGSVRTVGQLDAPWSVASLKQRLGRSGRRAGEAQILRMYVRENEAPAGADLFDRLHLGLIHALATTELLRTKWVEPAECFTADLSTLTHQIMSAVGETGGRPAAELYELLCRRGPFRDFEPGLFTKLLRQLGSRGVLEQMPGNDLILGKLGEAIYRHFTFYAAFQTPEMYTLVHESERLGTLDVVPEPGQHLMFAARRWLVTDVDNERKEVHVRPARGRKRTKFGGRGGLLHTRIVQEMRKILAGTEVPIYLDDAGLKLLTHARQFVQEAHLFEKSVIPLGPKKSCLLTWQGGSTNLTLAAMMITFDVHPREVTIGLELPMPADKVNGFIAEVRQRTYNPEHLALAVQDRMPKAKFDWLLGPELLAIQHARQHMNAREALSSL